MTPDEVQKAADLLADWATAQANLVNWSQAPIAVWADGRHLVLGGLGDAVRGILLDVGDTRMRSIAAQLKDLGVEPPVMADDIRKIVDNPRRDSDAAPVQPPLLGVIEDTGR